MDMISIDLGDENQSNHNISNISSNSLWQMYHGSAEKSSMTKQHYSTIVNNMNDSIDLCSSQSFLRVGPLELSPTDEEGPDLESSEVIDLVMDDEDDDIREEETGIQSPLVGSRSETDVKELTEAEKRQKEEEESERFAWELMRQEQNELYQVQLEYMRSQAEGLSEEDMRALELVLQEATGMVPGYHEQVNEEGYDETEEREEGEEDEEEDPTQWDYERLLELGNVLGDVKTERWRLRAKKVIQCLPTTTYAKIVSQINNGSSAIKTQQEKTDEMSDKENVQKVLFLDCDESILDASLQAAQKAACASRSQDYRCAVCMENYEESDDVYVLPCAHYFHLSCGDGWLADHNSCPICKVKVTASP